MAEEEGDGNAIGAEDFIRVMSNLLSNRHGNQADHTSNQPGSPHQQNTEPGPSRRGNIIQQVFIKILSLIMSFRFSTTLFNPSVPTHRSSLIANETIPILTVEASKTWRTLYKVFLLICPAGPITELRFKFISAAHRKFFIILNTLSNYLGFMDQLMITYLVKALLRTYCLNL